MVKAGTPEASTMPAGAAARGQVEVPEADAQVTARDPGAFRRWVRSLRPPTVHHVRGEDQLVRTAYGVLMVLSVLLPFLSAVVVLRQGWRPAGDNALIGLRVHDVLTGHFPLIGQPTTGENFGSGIETSHPGPIEFYLVAPFVALLGPIVGLAIGAAAINAAAMGGIAWVSFRRGGLGLMALSVVAVCAMTRSLGGNLLHDPVSSNVGAVMAVLLLYLSWSIIAGDVTAFPPFIFVATFALQDHLTYLGTGAPVVLLALAVGCWWLRQYWRRDRVSPRIRRAFRVSLVLGVVMWFPVLLDEVFGDHNLTAIFKTFTGSRTAGEGVMFAVKRLGEALAPWPMFSRRFGPLGYMHSPTTRELVSGYVVLALVIGLGIFHLRRKRTDLAALSLVVTVAAFAGAYSAVKLPVGAGIQASNLRWMWTVSAFAWVAMLWLAWEALKPAWRAFLGAPLLTMAGILLLLAMAGVVSTMDLQTDRDGTKMESATALIDRVRKELPKGTYRVKYAGGSVVVSIGPALVHALDHGGWGLKMDLGPFSRAYAEHREYEKRDEVDGTVLMTAEAFGSYPEGTKLLARERVHVGRQDAAENVIRVYLIDDEGKDKDEGS